MRSFLLQMNPNLQIIEQQAIKAYYDVDRNGFISKDEFLRAGARAQAAVANQQEVSSAFEEDEDASGDQSMPTAPLKNVVTDVKALNFSKGNE